MDQKPLRNSSEVVANVIEGNGIMPFLPSTWFIPINWCLVCCQFINPFCQKTRPSSDSEAATMYKLKGQSSNMQTGQGFKYKELVRPAGPSSWFVHLVCPAGPFSWSVQLVRPAGPSSWSVQLVRPAGLTSRPIYTLHLKDSVLRNAPCTLLLTYCILHIASCTLHSTHCILQFASQALKLTWCLLHIA